VSEPFFIDGQTCSRMMYRKQSFHGEYASSNTLCKTSECFYITFFNFLRPATATA